MIKLATIAFVLAALMGASMATRHFQRKSIPWALPIIHGLLAGTGLVLLGTALFSGSLSAVAWMAFGFFLLAAMGGVIVFQSYLRHQRLSSGMIIIHAMAAAMGLLFLIALLYARNVVRESSWAHPLKVTGGVRSGEQVADHEKRNIDRIPENTPLFTTCWNSSTGKRRQLNVNHNPARAMRSTISTAQSTEVRHRNSTRQGGRLVKLKRQTQIS